MKNNKIAVIGLGYVGLPLARLFATKFAVVGYDISQKRIHELQSGNDSTLEVESTLLKSVLKKNNNSEIGLYCSNLQNDIANSNIFIVTVPTPVDSNNKPNMKSLFLASKIVGEVIKKR